MASAHTPSSPVADTVPENRSACSWQQLQTTCRAADALARQVHSGLRQGADAARLIPLLQQEVRLARELQLRISELGETPPQDPSRTAHAELMAQMKSLLSMEEENHRLLRSRGVKLTGPRPPRVIRRRRPRPSHR